MITPLTNRTIKPARLLTTRVLAALVFLVVLLTFAPLALTAIGTWLVTEDPLQHAPAVVVFGGQVPFRAMEAAAIYRQGWTHEVWLTQRGVDPEDVALARLGIQRPPEYAYNRQVLERLGVSSNAIRVLNERNVNTAEEVRVIARELRSHGADRVILVTSKFHTRRVRVLWHALVGNHPEAIIRYTPDDPFEADHWFRNTEDGMAVSREWFGLLNAWAGFPVKSEHW